MTVMHSSWGLEPEKSTVVVVYARFQLHADIEVTVRNELSSKRSVMMHDNVPVTEFTGAQSKHNKKN